MTLQEKQTYVDDAGEGWWKALAHGAKASSDHLAKELDKMKLSNNPEEDGEWKKSIKQSYSDSYERLLDKIIDLHKRSKPKK